MNTVSKDVKNKLVTAGLVQTDVTKAWFVSLVDLPSTPRKVVCVRVSTGPGPQRYMDTTKTPMDEDGFQVFVRGESDAGAYSKAKAIADEILGWGRFSQGSTTYAGFAQRGNIVPFLKEEERGLHVYVANFVASREAQ